MPETVSSPTDLDLISFLQAIPDAWIRRGARITSWYLLLVVLLGILSRCKSLRDFERLTIRYHSVLTKVTLYNLRKAWSLQGEVVPALEKKP